MNSPAPNFLPWRLKNLLPVVVTFHDLRPPYLLPKAGSMRERTLQFMAQQARGIIATNAADLTTLESWSVKSARCIPIGSNIDVYHPNHIEIAEAREQSGLSDSDIMLGYFGFLNESKGAQTLLDALSALDERFHLVFIGGQTGDSDQANNQAYLTELRQQIDRAGLAQRVHWTGFLTPERVSTYLGCIGHDRHALSRWGFAASRNFDGGVGPRPSSNLNNSFHDNAGVSRRNQYEAGSTGRTRCSGKGNRCAGG